MYTYYIILYSSMRLGFDAVAGRATGHKHDTYKDLHLVLGLPFP